MVHSRRKTNGFDAARELALDADRQRTSLVNTGGEASLIRYCRDPNYQLSVKLLGGFRIDRSDGGVQAYQWARRSAKALTKVLSAWPGHSMHREQLIEFLWPGAETESALNSLAKALHAARRALEPGLTPRAGSAYLSVTDAMISLNTDHVLIDADTFEQLARQAGLRQDPASYEAALAAYQGDLLPEDRYEEWCAQRRIHLAELHTRLTLELADLLRQKGLWNESADRLREVLKKDPTREDVHRHLIRMYAEMGTADLAVRQFHLCKDVLRSELDLAPQPETVELYRDVLASRIVPQPRPESVSITAGDTYQAAAAAPVAPFVGREHAIQHMWDQLAPDGRQEAGMVLISGDTGVGKTRLVDEFAARAGERGAAVLWGGRTAEASELACSTFAVALERYVAELSSSERDELGLRHPGLAQFVPSLGTGSLPTAADNDRYHLEHSADIVRVLTDLGRRQPMVIVIGDLHRLDRFSLDLLPYLAQLAPQRSWLITGTVHEGEIVPGTRLWRMLDTMLRERVCVKFELRCLSRRSSDELVRALLGPTCPDDAALGQIFAESRGNPSLIKAMVGELSTCPRPRRPSATAESAAAGSTPVRVRALTARWMATVDETARRVLGLAAAAASAEISLADLNVAAAALEPPISTGTLFEALDGLLRMRLLEEHGGGYSFRYPIVRSAMWGDMARHRREQLRAALRAADCPCEA